MSGPSGTSRRSSSASRMAESGDFHAALELVQVRVCAVRGDGRSVCDHPNQLVPGVATALRQSWTARQAAGGEVLVSGRRGEKRIRLVEEAGDATARRITSLPSAT